MRTTKVYDKKVEFSKRRFVVVAGAPVVCEQVRSHEKKNENQTHTYTQSSKTHTATESKTRQATRTQRSVASRRATVVGWLVVEGRDWICATEE